MKSQAKIPRRQRGSVIITTAIAMSLIVICLIGIELGYLFFLKRELQKTVDLAALAGAQFVSSTSCEAAKGAAIDSANNPTVGNMPSGILAGLSTNEIECGTWLAMANAIDPSARFKVAETNLNAVQVTIVRTPPSLLSFFAANRAIGATATAATSLPRAKLEIRSTLASVDSSKSQVLNAVMGGLLGGSLNITAAGWNGLINTDVQLLHYIDALAAALTVKVGDYDALLRKEASAGELIDAAISALEAGPASGSSISAAITALEQIRLLANISSIKNLELRELLNLQTGNTAGLDTKLQVFQLAEGIIQLANSKSAVFASLPVTVPGIGTVTVKTKIIEPPQLSVIGNPQLAKEDPTGENRIFVRTAQVRTLVSINLDGLTGTVNSVLNAATAQLAPLTNFVNDVLKLNLVEAIDNFLGGLVCPIPLLGPCPSANAIYVKVASQQRIDIGLEAGGASAHVNDYSCSNDGQKQLTLSTSTSLAKLRIGSFGETLSVAEAAVFSPKLMPDVKPLPLIEIGQQTVRPDACLLTLCSGLKWKKGNSWVSDSNSADRTLESSLGIRGDTSIIGLAAPLYYKTPTAADLPEIHASTPAYQSIVASNIVESLNGTLGNVEIKVYRSTSSGVMGQILTTAVDLLNNLKKSLQAIVKNALSPLLDPLLNLLLETLGIDIAKAEVGAQMSCQIGAELVY